MNAQHWNRGAFLRKKILDQLDTGGGPGENVHERFAFGWLVMQLPEGFWNKMADMCPPEEWIDPSIPVPVQEVEA